MVDGRERLCFALHALDDVRACAQIRIEDLERGALGGEPLVMNAIHDAMAAAPEHALDDAVRFCAGDALPCGVGDVGHGDSCYWRLRTACEAPSLPLVAGGSPPMPAVPPCAGLDGTSVVVPARVGAEPI